LEGFTKIQRPRYEGLSSMEKKLEFQFYDDTKAKSIIATREFNSTDNSAHTVFYDQAKTR
jgi:hypothetical protein